MRRKIILIALLFVASAVSTMGQTAVDLTAKYGEPVRAYIVGEHIWMTPDYTSDGQVCQMRLYPMRVGAADHNYLSHRLSFQELKSVLNELVPPKVRGAKKESFAQTVTGGGSAWTTYPYEKVTFVFISSFKVDPATVQLKPYVFSAKALSNAERKSTKSYDATADDFVDSAQSEPEIVTITWNDRKCVSDAAQRADSGTKSNTSTSKAAAYRLLP
jgi:hypothetical protein